MKPPIIADNTGDVLVFTSVAKAERYMEPVDVKNKEYLVFDSQGSLLEATVTQSGNGKEHVTLKAVDREPQHQSLLRDTLIKLLRDAGELKSKLEDYDLDELVAKSVQFAIE